MTSQTDDLTGLPNRSILDTVRERFALQDNPETWTIMMIDVDDFKLVNDIYGHLIGDQILAAIGSMLREYSKSDDIIIRYGGDEFLAVFPGTQQEYALNYAERIRTMVRSTIFSVPVQLSVCIGVAESRPGESLLDMVIERADHALYHAKDSGKDTVFFYSDITSGRDRNNVRFHHFVGRKTEVRLLRKSLDEALDGECRVALIRGEDGVGKSSLVQELVHYARFRGCRILESGCHEFGDDIPFRMILNPVSQFYSELTDEDRIELRAHVESVNTATSEMFPNLDLPVIERPLLRRDNVKFQIFEDLAAILNALAIIKPILFIIEDLQWISDPDLELLAFLMRSFESASICFIITVRDQSQKSEEVIDRLETLRRSIPFETIRLENLVESETRSLLMLGLKDPHVPENVIRSLYRQSGGNPLFLKELIRTLIQEERIIPADYGGWRYNLNPELSLPASLSQLISRRLDVIHPVSRKLLRIASLASDTFTVDLLSFIAELPELEIAESLHGPVESGFVREENLEDGSIVYMFNHLLMKEYLRHELTDTLRSLYHGRMGEYYEKRCIADTSYIPTAAFHYGQSTCMDKGSEFALKAARYSERRGATHETIRWLKAYVKSTGDGSEKSEDVFYSRRLLGKLYSLTGEGATAELLLNQALETAATIDEKVSVLALIGDNYQKLSRYEEARTFYSQAIEDSRDTITHAEIIVSLVYLDTLEGDFRGGFKRLEHVREILDEAESDNGRKERVWAAYYKRMGDVIFELNPGPSAISYYEKARSLYQTLRDSVGESSVINNMSGVYSVMGDYEKTLDVLHRAERIDERNGDALGLAIVHYNKAETYASLNQISLAKDYYYRYQETSRRIENQLGLAYAEFGLGNLHDLESNYTAAERCYSDAAVSFDSLGSRQFAMRSRLRLVEVQLKAGNYRKACETFQTIGLRETEDHEPEISGDISYIRGLLIHLSPDARLEDHRNAVHHFRNSLEITEHIDLHPLIKRYLYCAHSLRAGGDAEEFCATIKKAIELLNGRLARLKSGPLRSSVLQIPEIRRLLRDYRECGRTDDSETNYK